MYERVVDPASYRMSGTSFFVSHFFPLTGINCSSYVVRRVELSAGVYCLGRTQIQISKRPACNHDNRFLELSIFISK